MALTLPDNPTQHFIDEVLLPAWDATEARGFDTHKRLRIAANETKTVSAGDTEQFDSVAVESGGTLTVDGTLETAELTLNGTLNNNGTVAVDGDLFVGLNDPTAEEFFAVAQTIDSVGAIYPSLIIQYSNETSGGDSTYDYLTTNGPGQTRTGTLLATARAQDVEDGYTGDSTTYSAAKANDIVVELIEAVENVCQRRADAPNSEFSTIGSQRGPDVPDDLDEDPPVRIAQCEIRYSWLRDP